MPELAAVWRADTWVRPYGVAERIVGAGPCPARTSCAPQPAGWRAQAGHAVGNGLARSAAWRYIFRPYKGDTTANPRVLRPKRSGPHARSTNKGNAPAPRRQPPAVRARTGAFSSFSRKGSEKEGGLVVRQNPLIARLGNGAVLWLSFGVNGQHDRLHPSQTHSLIRSPIGRGFWLRLRCRPSRPGRV